MEYILELFGYGIENLTKLSYKTLSSLETGKAVIESAVNRWEKIGFLDDIDDEEKKKELAIAFDNLSYDIMSENDDIIEIFNRYNFNGKYPIYGEDENGKIYDEDGDELVNDFADDFDFSVMIYPLLRRVLLGNIFGETGVDSFDYKKFISYLKELSFLAINYDYADELDDAEAEFLSILALALVSRFNTDNEEND